MRTDKISYYCVSSFIIYFLGGLIFFPFKFNFVDAPQKAHTARTISTIVWLRKCYLRFPEHQNKVSVTFSKLVHVFFFFLR